MRLVNFISQTLKKIIPNKVKIFLKTMFLWKMRTRITHLEKINACVCCGSKSVIETPVLWEQLIQDWQLTLNEVSYINRQQGFHCHRCKVRLRGMTLAYAMMRMNSYQGLFKDFVKTPWMRKKTILEVNRADWLTQYLKQIPGHILSSYPDVNLQNLPYTESTFDIVVHSDTLEHVSDPQKALQECRRVLKPNGFCAFTTPVIPDRLTKSRFGLPPSFHGAEDHISEDYKVQTEFGADIWKLAFEAGFSEVRTFALEYPAGLCFVFIK